MQAVILLAGENSRFWPLGTKRHKALYEVGLRNPILFYLLKECELAKIKEVIIVRRPKDKGLDTFLRKNKFSLIVKTVVQNKPLGMADALYSVRHLIKGDFFLLDGNQIFFSKITIKILPLSKKFSAILAVRKTDNPSLFGIAKINKNYLIKEILEKPTDLVSPQLKVTSTYYLKYNFLKFLKKHISNKDDGFEKALSEYAQHHKVLALPIDKLVPEITLKYPWNLFDVHKAILDKLTKIKYPQIHKTAVVDATAKITGKSILGPGVKVGSSCIINNSLLCEKVAIGKNCKVENSIVYKNVHIGDDCRIYDSILDEGCSLENKIKVKNNNKNKYIQSLVKGKMINSRKRKLGAIVGPSVKVKSKKSFSPGVKIGIV
jgi:bifunctional UDP-N-acetylglucosamine pyrophosphorylase/glucosamine-1-phosphate N-acetyltransferase